jgi:hypothetical protein
MNFVALKMLTGDRAKYLGFIRELLARDGLYARLYRLQASPLDVAVRSSSVPVLEV